MTGGPSGVGALLERLQELHARTTETPLFNPVFQLSLDLSRRLEANELDLNDVEALVAELECDALKSRAARLRALVAPVAPRENLDRFAASLEADRLDFTAFRKRWENPQLHAVFTAHPTFVLPPEQAQAVADAAGSEASIGQDVCVLPAERPQITLAYEHQQAMRAIAHG